MHLRAWQQSAVALWEKNGHRGIVSVVTGGGKTIFALACIKRRRPRTVVIIVPTQSLLDQWWEECSAFFDLPLDEINVLTSRGRVRAGTINICVINSAAKILRDGPSLKDCLLIVDECHRSASLRFRDIFKVEVDSSLGLSATPQRQYDNWLEEVVIPALGPIIFEYGYIDALRDGVIVPFMLRNVVFELEAERQEEYDSLTRKIARSIARNGADDPRTIGLLLKRTRVLNLSLTRIALACKLVARNRTARVLVFHEDIEACNLIGSVLNANGVTNVVYHSRQKVRQRADALASFRQGLVNVLVTCRALDEGFNVPETEIGIIAASTATRRQRIQRLGRVLRPSSGKRAATIYTLVATAPEIDRLKREEAELGGVAKILWSRA